MASDTSKFATHRLMSVHMLTVNHPSSCLLKSMNILVSSAPRSPQSSDLDLFPSHLERDASWKGTPELPSSGHRVSLSGNRIGSYSRIEVWVGDKLLNFRRRMRTLDSALRLPVPLFSASGNNEISSSWLRHSVRTANDIQLLIVLPKDQQKCAYKSTPLLSVALVDTYTSVGDTL